MIRSALLFAVVVLFVVHPLHAQAQTFEKGGRAARPLSLLAQSKGRFGMKKNRAGRAVTTR